jgi:hypothetical protein
MARRYRASWFHELAQRFGGCSARWAPDSWSSANSVQIL